MLSPIENVPALQAPLNYEAETFDCLLGEVLRKLCHPFNNLTITIYFTYKPKNLSKLGYCPRVAELRGGKPPTKSRKFGGVGYW